MAWDGTMGVRFFTSDSIRGEIPGGGQGVPEDALDAGEADAEGAPGNEAVDAEEAHETEAAVATEEEKEEEEEEGEVHEEEEVHEEMHRTTVMSPTYSPRISGRM
eukprot:jgi/Tetstr1/446885/TSEL_003665.t1